MNQFTPLPAGGVLVGGAVRDALLGRPFDDLDWLVSDPEQAARQAADTLAGSVFALDKTRGHWRVVSEGAVRDYIRLATTLETDLHTRDFTVNAMAADTHGTPIDPLGGQRDLARRHLRMVSRDNLWHDPLRALRGVRLGVQLGLRLHNETARTIAELSAAQRRGEVPHAAPERVAEEFAKLLLAPRASAGLAQLDSLGLLDLYLPELAAGRAVEQGGFHHLDVLAHQLEAFHQLLLGFPEADLTLRWATLLHDVGKPATKTFDEGGRFYHFYGHDKLGATLTRQVLTRLRLPSETVRRAALLVRYHMLPLPQTTKEARRFVHRRRELLPDLLSLMIADREAARGPMSSQGSRRAYRTALSRVLDILAQPPPPAPLMDGREVMRVLGLAPGPRVGEALRFVQEAEAVGDVTSKTEAVAALTHYAQTQGWV